MEGSSDLEQTRSSGWPWWREGEVWLLVLLVGVVYFTRLTALPIRGEESRWVRVAVLMIELDDWLVPRQQGTPHLDRPPLGPWAIAAVALLRGKVDLVAVRLPSVVGVLLTTVLIYAYGRSYLRRLGALAAAAAYASAGQVLQIGRLGENEGLYTLAVSGSLLLWHCGYVRGWPKSATWAVGFACAAMATLIKGPQGLIYFVAPVFLYLVIRRDRTWLFSRSLVVGACAFGAILSLWLIPFLQVVTAAEFITIFTVTNVRRYALHGLLEHMAQYPVEILICLLPWSPLLLGFARPRVRRAMKSIPPPLWFMIVAVLSTFPVVWFAAGARARYFMPLYPCISVIVGWIVEQCALRERASAARRGWELYVVITAACVAIGGVTILMATMLPIDGLAPIAQPQTMAIVCFLSGVVVAGIMIVSVRSTKAFAAEATVMALAGFTGLLFTGVVINSWLANANDPTAAVARVKAALPDSSKIVSFGAIDHRFAYYYEQFIQEFRWPLTMAEVPADLEYFCINRNRGDSPTSRHELRFKTDRPFAGTLPFAWEEVAVVPHMRTHARDPQAVTVIGRAVRPLTPVPPRATQAPSPSLRP